MHAILFARVEIVPVLAVTEDCWTHDVILPLGRHVTWIEELKRVHEIVVLPPRDVAAAKPPQEPTPQWWLGDDQRRYRSFARAFTRNEIARG